MKSKSVILLAVAAGCGLVAMLGVQRMLSGNQNNSEQVAVLVARTDIDPGVRLDETNVAFHKLPKESVPPGAVTSKEEFDDRALKSRAFAGQPIALQQLGEKGIYGSTITIPVGMRVVTVAVNATMTHSGLMKAGDRVDLLVTYKVTKPKIGTVSRTKTFLKHIEVYSMDRTVAGSDQIEKAESIAKNVSLVVTPEQANLLKLAESKGPLHLALRSKLDDADVAIHDADDSVLDSTQGIFDEPVEVKEPEPTPVVAEVVAEPVKPVEVVPPSEPVEPRKEGPKKPSFGMYLAERFASAAMNAASQPLPPVEKKMWKIEIYSGPDLKVQEVELPEIETDAASKEDRQVSIDPASVEAARSFMKGLLAPAPAMVGVHQEDRQLKIRAE